MKVYRIVLALLSFAAMVNALALWFMHGLTAEYHPEQARATTLVRAAVWFAGALGLGYEAITTKIRSRLYARGRNSN